MGSDGRGGEGATGRPRVVVVGAGFGGLAAVKAMAHLPVEVTVIDRRNHHLFQPLLYQVATAGLNPSDIAHPIRRIVRDQTNCRVVLDEVVAVDRAASTVRTATTTVGYDYLVLATGATHAYFGHDEWAVLAPGLKTIEDALEIRRRVLTAFERAEATDDPAERRRLMTFVVVGAGPTGVELAGAIAEIATTTLRPDFRSIDTTDSATILVEAGPRVLPTFVPRLSAAAARHLDQLGVEVRTDCAVTEISELGVATTCGSVPAGTVLWAAGVAASPLGRQISDEVDRAGRVPVGPDLTVADRPEIFVIGDLAAVRGPDGEPVPGVAPAAQQAGDHVAASIEADLAGRPRPVFRYRDKGSMATVGRSAAVVDLGRGLRFSGLAAWVVWWLVHIWSLIEFRSRLRVMGSWGWQYLTGRRDARLITDTSLAAGPGPSIPDPGEAR